MFEVLFDMPGQFLTGAVWGLFALFGLVCVVVGLVWLGTAVAKKEHKAVIKEAVLDMHATVLDGEFNRAGMAAFYGTAANVQEYREKTRWKRHHYDFGSGQQVEDAQHCGFQEGLRKRAQG